MLQSRPCLEPAFLQRRLITQNPERARVVEGESATVGELSRLAQCSPAAVRDRVSTLRDLGLAVELSDGLWRALPLSEVVRSLRAQRLTELEMASIAAEISPV